MYITSVLNTMNYGSATGWDLMPPDSRAFWVGLSRLVTERRVVSSSYTLICLLLHLMFQVHTLHTVHR